MKTAIALLLITGCAALAQGGLGQEPGFNPAAADARLDQYQHQAKVELSQMEAARRFPDLTRAGSDFNTRFVSRVAVLRSGSDAVMQRDDWPLLVAREIAIELAPVNFGMHAPAQFQMPQMSQMPQETFIPEPVSTDPMNPAHKLQIYGTVTEKTDKGLVVYASRPPNASMNYTGVMGRIWLRGKDAQQGETIKTRAVKIGTMKSGYLVDRAAQLTDVYEVATE